MLELQKGYISDLIKPCIPQKDYQLNLEMYFESFKNQNITERFYLKGCHFEKLSNKWC